MFYLISKARRLDLPIDIQLQLFDSTVLPILLYGCEIWGYSNVPVLENLHLKFLKILLGVHSKTCNNMVYGELGRYPLNIIIKQRVVGYWARMLSGKETKLTRLVYNQVRDMHTQNLFKSDWLEFLRDTLADCGMVNIWESNQSVSVNELKSKVHTKLKENFISKWLNELSTMSSCDVYVNFKTNFALEQYLIELSPHLRLSFCRFRLSNTRLPKVLGRFTNTPRDQRFCTLCTMVEKPGVEFHLLFECNHPQLVLLRDKYIPNSFSNLPCMQKCVDFIGNDNPEIIRKLSVFLKNSLKLLR